MSATDVVARQTIRPRGRTFDFAAVDDRHWLGGDAFRTRFFDAFSTMLPIGERFFIAALRRVEGQLADPQLTLDIKGLVEQEAVHAREHRRYNDRLRAMGVPLDAMDRSQARVMGRIERMRDPRLPLAVTVALEHVTAQIGRALLAGRLIDHTAHPEMRSFWLWHAAEELEHKDVAIRAYRAAGGSEALRIVALGWGALIVGVRMTNRMRRMLALDGRRRDPATWRSGAGFLLGRDGFARAVGPGLLRYARRDFDPGAVDDAGLLAAWAADDGSDRPRSQPPRTGAGPRRKAKVVPARTGVLFEALAQVGEDTRFTIELRDLAGHVVAAEDIDHRRHDGYGAMVAFLGRRGIPFSAPASRRDTTVPSLRQRIAALGRVTAAAKTEPFAMLRTRSSTEGHTRQSVGVLLDDERSEQVRRKASAALVSPNSWMLCSLNHVVTPRLSPQATATATWGVPLNMRGPIEVDPPLANCSSIVPVSVPAGATPGEVHAAVRWALAENLHWGKWDQVNLMARLGRRGALRQVRRYYATAGDQRVGVFSNVGEWSGEAAPDIGVVAYGVPTRADPLFATALSFNGRIGLSLRTHARLDVGPDELHDWLTRWVDRLTGRRPAATPEGP